MMRLFASRPLDDEHIHLFDVANWIAFGWIPEQGYRFDRDAIVDMEGAQWDARFWLSIDEIATLLPDVPLDEYLHLREISGTDTPQDVQSDIDEPKMRDWRMRTLRDPDADQQLLEFFVKREDDLRQKLEAAQQIRKFHTPLDRAFDRAKIDVLRALMDGQVIGTGLLESGSDDTEWHAGDFQSIRPDDWTLAGVDWNKSNLEIDGGKYLAVSVPLADCLRIFPSTMVAPRRISGTLHGGTFIPDESEEDLPIASRHRGRPRLGEGFAETAVLNAMRIKRRQGELPTKREAILAEATGWHQAHFGKHLPRSTAQRFLAPLFAEMPKNDQILPDIEGSAPINQ